jgi:RNA polymerase sigma factor (sigma-70 family)
LLRLVADNGITTKAREGSPFGSSVVRLCGCGAFRRDRRTLRVRGGCMAPQPQSHRDDPAPRAQLLDQLLRTKRPQLLGQARRHSRRAQDAEDALGDACVQFLRFYDSSSERDPLPWMLVVVKRCAWAIDRRRKGRESGIRVSGGELSANEPMIVVGDERSGPVERIERSEESAQVLALVEELKSDERTALILFGLGYSYAEIAELRGWTMTKVNRCLSEGKAKVREWLGRG